MQVQMNNHLKNIFRYVLGFLFIIMLTYITIVFKMPWLYNASLIQNKNNNLLDQECYSAYMDLLITGDDSHMIRLDNAGASFCLPYLDDGSTLLHNAAIQNKIDACKWLIEHANIDPNVKNNAGLTPLDCILWKGMTYEYIKGKGGKHSWKYYFWLQFLNWK